MVEQFEVALNGLEVTDDLPSTKRGHEESAGGLYVESTRPATCLVFKNVCHPRLPTPEEYPEHTVYDKFSTGTRDALAVTS